MSSTAGGSVPVQYTDVPDGWGPAGGSSAPLVARQPRLAAVLRGGRVHCQQAGTHRRCGQ